MKLSLLFQTTTNRKSVKYWSSKHYIHGK